MVLPHRSGDLQERDLSVKRLTLKAERLAELTDDELRYAVGGTFSASTCVVSLEQPCTTFFATRYETRCIVDYDFLGSATRWK